MKKIFRALVVFLVAACAMPVFACSQVTGNMTGGACSIKELQNLEKTKTSQEKVFFQLKPERNLRPVKTNPEIRQMPIKGCLFETCLLKEILDK